MNMMKLFDGFIDIVEALHKFDEQHFVVVPRPNNPGNVDTQLLSHDFVIAGVVNEYSTVVVYLI